MKRLVIGDIHGAYRALVQVLDRAGFDPKKDLLVSLGDVCDGWSETKQCIDYLMTVKNLVYVRGNHDEWTHEWMCTGRVLPEWWTQGGKETVTSFNDQSLEQVSPYVAVHLQVPPEYRDFFYNAVPWHHIDDKKCPDTVFVHGGFHRDYRIEEHGNNYEFTWDRNLIYRAMQNQIIADKQKLIPKNVTKHSRVFLGHTALNSDKPLKFCEIWNMDTGAGWSGYLSVMDIDTEEYWVSDKVSTLYPGIAGRN